MANQSEKIEKIHRAIEQTDGLILSTPFTVAGRSGMTGWVGSVTATGPKNQQTFHIEVPASYPFAPRSRPSGILVTCPQASGYRHVMTDQTLCLRSRSSLSFDERLREELALLRTWFEDYVIDEIADDHYEYPVVPADRRSDMFYFTDSSMQFKRKTTGRFAFRRVAGTDGSGTFVTTSFDVAGEAFPCDWSESYLRSMTEEGAVGIFFLIHAEPSYRQFVVVRKWSELEQFFNDSMKRRLHRALTEGDVRHVLLGYRIPDGSINWLAIKVAHGQIPLIAVNQEDRFVFRSDRIIWCRTENLSFPRFFGRGALSEAIVKKRIGIIGVGAVGSMLAESLVRGGARFVAISDCESVEPGNVCRSQYSLIHAGYSKEETLQFLLQHISPLVQLESFTIAKSAPDDRKHFLVAKNLQVLSDIDLLFDCTADNELCYYLDFIGPPCQTINVSISNQARELVVVSGSEIPRRKNVVFDILPEVETDMYEPLGCWSPTFRASYNEIRLLVETAMGTINRRIDSGASIGTFVVRRVEDGGTVGSEVKDY